MPSTSQNCPKLTGTAGIFSSMKQGVKRTRLLAGTVYSDRTGRYGTKLITLLTLFFIMIQQCTYQNKLHYDGYGQVKDYNEIIYNLNLQYQVNIFQYFT